MVMEHGATYLPGCSLKYDTFIPCMWQAVQTGHVTHADALACGEGLRYGFTCGVDISKLQGYLTFENYQSGVPADLGPSMRFQPTALLDALVAVAGAPAELVTTKAAP